MVKKNYKREVTHTQYTFMSEAAKQVGIVNKLDKEITENNIDIKKRTGSKGEVIQFVDDRYMTFDPDQKVFPLWGGGAFLILFLIFFIPNFFRDWENESISNFEVISMIVLFLGVSFCAYYYYSMPYKETIYNRNDSLITFPGFMWKPNITMSIHDVEFAFSQPSAQGIGAYQLRIVRPDKMFSQYNISWGQSCYIDLTFYLWYMDKNRPLPPGDAFDAFRDQDFERRKTAGFPKPMFPARFDTPEATKEQQAERKRIGRW